MPFREMKDDRGVLEVWDPALEAYASEYTIIEDESYTSADLVDMLWPGKKRPAYVRLAKRDGETEGRVLPRDSLMIDTRHHIAEGYAGLRFELSASSIGMFLPLGNIEGPRLGQLRSRAIRFRGVPNQAHRPNTQVVLYPVQVIVNFYDVYKDFYGRNYLNVMPKNDCMLDTICTASIELAEKFGFAHSGLQAPSLRYTEKQIQCVVPKDDDRKFSTQECADMHVNFDPDLLGGFASPSKSPQKGNANSKSKPMKGKAKDDHDAAGEEEEKSGNHSMKMKQAAMKAVMKSMKTSKRGNDEEDEAEKEDEMNDSKKTKSNAGTPMKPKRSSINTLPSPLLHDKMVGQHLVPYIRDYTSNNTYDSMYGKASVLRCCILMPLVVKKKMEENQDSQASALAAAGLG
ncbi:unnamed protein product [Amoebophrya sp. A25]|nr:unnamed protein product [Amoebophrya sp. A25]|eukprot:GSA25T00025116001.1